MCRASEMRPPNARTNALVRDGPAQIPSQAQYRPAKVQYLWGGRVTSLPHLTVNKTVRTPVESHVSRRRNVSLEVTTRP